MTVGSRGRVLYATQQSTHTYVLRLCIEHADIVYAEDPHFRDELGALHMVHVEGWECNIESASLTVRTEGPSPMAHCVCALQVIVSAYLHHPAPGSATPALHPRPSRSAPTAETPSHRSDTDSLPSHPHLSVHTMPGASQLNQNTDNIRHGVTDINLYGH